MYTVCVLQPFLSNLFQTEHPVAYNSIWNFNPSFVWFDGKKHERVSILSYFRKLCDEIERYAFKIGKVHKGV